MSHFDFDHPFERPIRLTTPLPFLEEDREAYPWLSSEDRYYALERSLGKGGFSLAFACRPCDSYGTPLPDSPTVVAKIPNLAANRLSNEITTRLSYIEKQSIAEWELIRRKLLKCKYANPVFDAGHIYAQTPLVPLFVTIKPFISDAVPLKQWVADQGLRAKLSFDEKGVEIQDWRGISQWRDWLSLTTIISDAVVELHRRRVIHGDLWPPNVYVTSPPHEHAVLIDFGESFVATPSGEPRIQRNHAYRAPERDKAEHVPTEQIDVYSFGKLMLYLAIGIDKEIPREHMFRPLYGHRRRAYVREVLFQRNPGLSMAHPELLDLISQCVAMDPVGRPTMQEINDQLSELCRVDNLNSIEETDLSLRLEALTEKVKSAPPNRVFARIMDRKIVEVERLLDTCQTEMVEITGPRDVLIAALVALFSELGANDSWTTLTTPAVWQKNALGLDGRYSTATIHALRRGATVQRTHIVSVEEVGVTWSRSLAARLNNTGEVALRDLAARISKCIIEYEFYATQDDFKRRTRDFCQCHQGRFAGVVTSLADMVRNCAVASYLYADQYSDIQTSTGLYLGLIPVATMAKVRELKAVNAHSLMYTRDGSEERDRWLLVMTDIRGRHEDEPQNLSGSSSDLGSSDEPQLRRVRVYRSVMGVPKERILSMERLLSTRSVNIGTYIERIAECLPDIDNG